MTATYKATEQYLDDEDWELYEPLDRLSLDAQWEEVKVSDLLKALEDLRNHLRGKYYAG